jgi:hypothetical protein
MMETLTAKQTKCVAETFDAVLPDAGYVNDTYSELDEATETQSTLSPIGGASVSLMERSSSVGGIAPTGAPESAKQQSNAPAVPVVASEEDGVVKVIYFLIM